MKSWKDFGIDRPPETTNFTGPRIEILKIINREITVNAWRIKDSKFEGDRLDLDITYKGVTYLLWTSSKALLDDIKKASPEVAFTTTIVEEGKKFLFT